MAAALSYKRGRSLVRRAFIATGRGALAEHIVDLAFQNGVRVREDKDLAELLASVDVGCEIPTEALVAGCRNHSLSVPGKCEAQRRGGMAVSEYTDKIEEKLSNLASALESAAAAIAQGDYVDLTGLDYETNVVCTLMVQDVPEASPLRAPAEIAGGRLRRTGGGAGDGRTSPSA